MPDTTSTTTPTWDEVFTRIGNEEWLTAKALLEVDPYRVVKRDAACWLRYAERAGYRDRSGAWQREPELDWEAWVGDVEEHGRAWSSTQWCLFEVVAGLTTGRPFSIVGTLDQMDSWEPEVWRILVEWGTGGNNRDLLGRSTATVRTCR